MSVLVVGCNGSMGKRYCAILDYLGVDYEGVDKGEEPTRHFNKVIIATPTSTHFTEILKYKNYPILCEKPVSTNLNQIRLVEKYGVQMVCNWAYIFTGKILVPENNDISYNYYNTGRDGPRWDCIQLYYLSKAPPSIMMTSPVFHVIINGIPVQMEQIQRSYVLMVQDWLDGKPLWDMGDAFRATKKVLPASHE